MTVKDFTRPRKQISFTIDDDTFDAKSPIPAQVLMDFAKKFSNMTEDATVEEQMSAFTAVLDLVLKPKSKARFFERMSDDENPIEIVQVEQIIEWLFEEYGLRPTEQPSASAPGLPDPAVGTSSMGSMPAEVLTS